MNRLTWTTIIWALVASATFKDNLVAYAETVDENMNIDKLNSLLSQQNNRLSLDHNDRLKDQFNMKERIEDKSGIYEKEPGTIEEDVDETEEKDDTVETNENETVDAEAIRKRRKNRMTDILVACFFFVAAIWLILATGYSVILLILLRLQARGELDIYDENLGRVVLYNGRITLHFGCILRRYAVQLEEDYQRQIQQRFGDSNAESEAPQRIRIMTREERRNAVEELLGGSAKTLDVESGSTCDKKKCSIKCSHATTKADASKKPFGTTSTDTSVSCSEEEPVCSICLVEYEPTDSVFRSKSCPHMFHGDCLFSWLERRNNTECPCCREPLVSDDDIWKVVQRMRQERRETLRKENGWIYRFVKWTKSRTNQQDVHQQDVQPPPAIPSVETERTDSSTSLSSGSDDEIILDQDTSSSTELNEGDTGGDGIDDHVEESSAENNV